MAAPPTTVDGYQTNCGRRVLRKAPCSGRRSLGTVGGPKQPVVSTVLQVMLQDSVPPENSPSVRQVLPPNRVPSHFSAASSMLLPHLLQPVVTKLRQVL